MLEWSNRTVSKTVVPATVPWVRIPPLPQKFKVKVFEIGGLGASRRKVEIVQDFPSVFEIKIQSLLGNLEVRTNLFEKIPNSFGIFFSGDNFGFFAGLYKL